MEETSFLYQDETVLWQGRPTRGTAGLMEWRNVFTGLVVLLCVGGLALVYVLSEPEWQPPLVVLLCVIALCAGCTPLLTLYRLRGQSYWITDQRAVVVSREGNIYSMALPTIRDLELVDTDCVVMSNEPLDGTIHQTWRIAGHPQSARSAENQTSADAIAFFRTERAGEAVRLLRSMRLSQVPPQPHQP